MNRVCVIFARCRQAAFHKDPVLIPHTIAAELGVPSIFVHTDLEPVVVPQSLRDVVEVVGLGESPSRIVRFQRILNWIRLNAHRFDTLLIYQLTWEAVVWAEAYKMLNASGVCGLKLDLDERSAAMLNERQTTKELCNDALFARSRIDFFSVETKSLQKVVQQYFTNLGKPLVWLPNGISKTFLQEESRAKGNVILSVGRLGTEQKNSELLLSAYLRLPETVRAEWQLWFVGEATPKFQALLSETSEASVKYLGEIRDRERLASIFAESKVFALSSRWESFGLVLLEAAAHGCTLVSTKVGVAEDLIESCGNGYLAEERVDGFTRALMEAVELPDSQRRFLEQEQRVLMEYSWKGICESLLTICDEYRMPLI